MSLRRRRAMLAFSAVAALFLVTAIRLDAHGALARCLSGALESDEMDGLRAAEHRLVVTSGEGRPPEQQAVADESLECAEVEDVDPTGEAPGPLDANALAFLPPLPQLPSPTSRRAPLHRSPTTPGLMSRRF